MPDSAIKSTWMHRTKRRRMNSRGRSRSRAMSVSRSRSRSVAVRGKSRRMFGRASGKFAKKVKEVLKKELEHKHIYTNRLVSAATPAAPNSSGVIGDVTQGTSLNTRTGDVITPIRFRARYMFSNTSAFTTYVRYAVVKVTNMAATANFALTTSLWWLSDALNTDVAYTALITANPAAAIQAKFSKDQVVVIFDKTIKLGKTGETGGSSTKSLTCNKKLAGKVEYEGATAGALLASQRYYEIIICYSPEGAATVGTVGDTKFTFVDG